MTANETHDPQMPELIAKANQAILEAHWLRREGRSLRFAATVLASELGATIMRYRAADNEPSRHRTDPDPSRSEP